MHQLDFSSCRNAYTDRTILSKSQSTTLGILLTFELLLTLPLNALLIFGILKTKLSDSTTWRYIFLLGISGCFLGIIVIPINILLFTKERKMRNCDFEYSAIFIGQTVCQFTAYLIFLLALHRYFISLPDAKGSWSTFTSKTGSRRLVICVFIVSLLHGAASVDFFGKVSTPIPNIAMKVIDFILGLMVYSIYLRLYLRIRRYAKQLRVRFNDVPIETRQPQTKRVIRKPKYVKELALTISFVLLAVAIGYVPFIVMDCWTSWYTFVKSKTAPQNVRFVYYMTYGSVFFTSVANAAIILYRNRDLKALVKATVRDLVCSNGEISPDQVSSNAS